MIVILGMSQKQNGIYGGKINLRLKSAKFHLEHLTQVNFIELMYVSHILTVLKR